MLYIHKLVGVGGVGAVGASAGVCAIKIGDVLPVDMDCCQGLLPGTAVGNCLVSECPQLMSEWLKLIKDAWKMTGQPQGLTAAVSKAHLSQIRLVATDMDGTLTADGEFTPMLLEAFESLRHHKIEVMIVTGRSAGWVSAIVNYLPVVGAIAENGGLYIDKQQPDPIILPDIPRMSQHRDRLSKVFQKLQQRHPHLKPSLDNPYRITDWTFDVAGLEPADIDWLRETCQAQTMGFTYSNVQCHIQVLRQNKAAGLKRVLAAKFDQLSADAVLTVGDSPNDESLFDAEQFPHSVGVANVAHYLPRLGHMPTYITSAAEVQGFVELTRYLVN